jgi:dTDP-4-amino-4,6-dideoxygalactose transaminase
MTKLQVPFFRAEISEQELEEVYDTLRSGWLTSGPKVKRFEQAFADAVGARHAIAVNSCTAALHLAVEAMGLKADQAVLVPTMTFAATAEVVRYLGATPVLVDCHPVTGNMSLEDAARKLAQLRAGTLLPGSDKCPPVVGMIPVHVGGLMMDLEALHGFASEHGLWVIEDAAHAFPSSWRKSEGSPWQRCGGKTAAVTCFSFYANKTITTGEGGMAVTDDAALAERMRLMSLHGLSHDAWERYSGGGSWDYKIVAPGFKYNLTDIAAAIGIHQLARADEMRHQRESVAHYYFEALADVQEIEMPPDDVNRIHSWHLFPIKLRLERLNISRNAFIQEIRHAGVGCSVHWRPLHLHPYYGDTFGWRPEDLPVATAIWERLVSLPIFPGMRRDELEYVIETVKSICRRHMRESQTIALAARPLRKTA